MDPRGTFVCGDVELRSSRSGAPSATWISDRDHVLGIMAGSCCLAVPGARTGVFVTSFAGNVCIDWHANCERWWNLLLRLHWWLRATEKECGCH